MMLGDVDYKEIGVGLWFMQLGNFKFSLGYS